MSSEAQERRSATRATPATSRNARATATRGVAAFVAALSVLAGVAFIMLAGSGATASTANAAAGASPFLRAFVQGGDGATFSHSTPRHASLACDSCHRRDSDAQPRLPGHRACTDCHLPQFMTSGSALCSNCHTNLESGNPPLKAFPGLKSFNARFDHAKHLAGAARPEAGCASCHTPARRGVALSIPAGLDAHRNCYQCHTPGAQSGGRDISSCAACHSLGRYARTPTNAASYRVGFSHATHRSMRCDDCHGVRAGEPQRRQVTEPRPAQHFASGRAQSCMTCHNGRRAFGGDDFASCKRCHKGQTFRF